MQGGPSQVDTFDYKPELYRWDSREVEFLSPRPRTVEKRKVFRPRWDFARHGKCGQHVSSLFPETARHVDDLCFIKSMHTEGVAHGPATLFLHTGATNLVRPSLGAWISYGLGSETENLPAFVTVNPPANKGGPRNYDSAFLPARHQATVLGSPGDPNARPEIRHIQSPLPTPDARRRHDYLHRLNALQAAARPDPNLDGVLDAMELAWRMQTHAIDLVNPSRESAATRQLYGIGHEPTDGFGRQCPAAR